MKYQLLAFALLLSGSVWAAPQAKAAEYNINVHVVASRSVLHSENAPRYQRLNVTIDGKNYELESIRPVRGVLMIGDYKARLEDDERGKDGYDSRKGYEFQLSDKRTRQFLVVGELE